MKLKSAKIKSKKRPRERLNSLGLFLLKTNWLKD
jgi:hypothetical protein